MNLPEEGSLFDTWVITVTQWLTGHSHVIIAMSTAKSWEELLPARVWSSFDSRCVSLKPKRYALSTWCHHVVLWTQACMQNVPSHPVTSWQREKLPREFGRKKSCTLKWFLWGAILYLAASWSEQFLAFLCWWWWLTHGILLCGSAAVKICDLLEVTQEEKCQVKVNHFILVKTKKK